VKNNIVDEFNPFSLSHIREWHFLSQNGRFPEESEFSSMDFPTNWQIQIMNKMANCLVRLMLNNQIIGIPPSD